MKSVLWFRVASILLLAFATGHTLGFLTLKAPTAEGQAVWAAMQSVRVPMGKTSFTYANFYIGFGLFVSALFLLEAFLAWYAGRMVALYPPAAITLGFCLLVLQLFCLVLCWRYFGTIQIVFSVLTIVPLVIALALVLVKTWRSGAA